MKFVVSAPGKIILFGEHAVVYGYPAISAAIDLRCHFEVITEQCNTNSEFLTVYFQDLDQKTVSLPKSLCSTSLSYSVRENMIDYSWSVVSNILGQSIDPLSRQNALNRSLCVLVYLIVRISSMKSDLPPSDSFPIFDNVQNFTQFNVYSDIPKSSGLGSSGAYSVCASTVLLYLFGYLPFDSDWIPTLEQSNWIQKLAHEAETIIHGKSSGLDTSTSTQGGLLFYQNSGQPSMKSLALDDSDMSKLNILLVDSHLTRSTQTIVQKLSHAYATNPDIGQIFQDIGNLVQTAVNLFSQPYLDLGKFELLVRKNQGFLHKLQVSCSQLDDLVDYLNKSGVSAKLTGAGCGGCIIGFPLLIDHTSLNRILDYFHQEKQLWAQIVQISDRGVRFKICSL